MQLIARGVAIGEVVAFLVVGGLSRTVRVVRCVVENGHADASVHHEGLVRKIGLGFDDNLARCILVVGTVNTGAIAVIVGVEGQKAGLVGHTRLLGKCGAAVPGPVACRGKKADCHACLNRLNAQNRGEIAVRLDASLFGATHRFVDGVAPSVVARNLKIHACEVCF